jgi:hypothetical protein
MKPKPTPSRTGTVTLTKENAALVTKYAEQSELREACAAGWNAFLATHSGLLIAHGIKDFRLGFEEAWAKYWKSRNERKNANRRTPEA